jgi:hypothetical protein
MVSEHYELNTASLQQHSFGHIANERQCIYRPLLHNHAIFYVSVLAEPLTGTEMCVRMIKNVALSNVLARKKYSIYLDG